MRRLIFYVALIAIVVGAIAAVLGRRSDVAIVNAHAVALSGQPGLFLLTFDVQNTGSAKQLSAIDVPDARGVEVMNPGYDGLPLAIPAGGTGKFAMDGAHVVVTGPANGFETGSSIPLTVSFEGYGDVSTRALVRDDAANGMNHSTAHGIQSAPAPSVTLKVEDGFSTAGADFTLEVENFTFARLPDDAPHVPQQGHAHIYLNGLKLGRLYDTGFSVGALPPGTHDIMVALNSNTHRPYMQNGEPVRDAVTLKLD